MTIFAGFLVLLQGYSMGDSEVLWQRRRFQAAKIVGVGYPEEILSRTLGTPAQGTLRVRLCGGCAKGSTGHGSAYMARSGCRGRFPNTATSTTHGASSLSWTLRDGRCG